MAESSKHNHLAATKQTWQTVTSGLRRKQFSVFEVRNATRIRDSQGQLVPVQQGQVLKDVWVYQAEKKTWSSKHL